MKVLVTGATGFLGGALTNALIGEGQEVRVLARKTSNLNRLSNLPVDVRYGSLEDKPSLIALLEGIDFVYHCAALATDWASWNDFFQANVQGVKNLLEAASEAGNVRRFVHISTTDVYGYPVQAVEETYPITDIGLPYNRSKGLEERAVWDSYRETGLPVTVIRPATIYGPCSLSIVVEIAALLLHKQMVLIDGGRHCAGLLYIDNAVEGIRQAALSPQTIGQAYNLRDEGNETWRQFAGALATGLDAGCSWINLPGKLALGIAHLFEIVYRVMGIRSRPLLTRDATYLLYRDQGYPIKKAKQDFSFRSTVSFAEGMERTLAWLASEEGQGALSGKPK
jgi:nucleoside-diphosphate-sugar epimerase